MELDLLDLMETVHGMVQVGVEVMEMEEAMVEEEVEEMAEEAELEALEELVVLEELVPLDQMVTVCFDNVNPGIWLCPIDPLRTTSFVPPTS